MIWPVSNRNTLATVWRELGGDWLGDSYSNSGESWLWFSVAMEVWEETRFWVYFERFADRICWLKGYGIWEQEKGQWQCQSFWPEQLEGSSCEQLGWERLRRAGGGGGLTKQRWNAIRHLSRASVSQEL